MKPSGSVPFLLAILPFLIGLWGCSAAIALSQYSERTTPHLIEDNATRAEVERKLGTPVTTMVFDDDSIIPSYQKKLYNPSRFWSDPPEVHAFLYVAYDFVTLGLMEAFMTPLESGGKIARAAHGTTYEVTVAYEPDGRVVGVSRKEAGN